MQHYQTLKDQHRSTRDGMPEALNLRIHRALSWLNRADTLWGDACYPVIKT